jgi:nicotinate-nucleotide pyrophosphorylase (carboxylating)
MGFPPPLPPERNWLPLIELAIGEDLGSGDATTPLIIDVDRQGSAIIEARESLIVCGLEIALAVFHSIDPQLKLHTPVRDGTRAQAGAILAKVTGKLHSILAAERTALNFLGRMCGVATWTRRFVDAVEGTGSRIVDTRKTLPGWRILDKYAVATGGATNHRLGLYDGILLKDNHVAIAGGVGLAVKAALTAAPANLRVTVEVESEAQAVEAVEAGAEYLLLDNRTLPELRGIVDRLGGRVKLEASGGVQLDNVRAVAETGVHRISIGALTHSAPAADLALEIEDSGLEPGGVAE